MVKMSITRRSTLRHCNNYYYVQAANDLRRVIRLFNMAVEKGREEERWIGEVLSYYSVQFDFESDFE